MTLIKELQKLPPFREAWVAHCRVHQEGALDPGRMPSQFLEAFLRNHAYLIPQDLLSSEGLDIEPTAPEERGLPTKRKG